MCSRKDPILLQIFKNCEYTPHELIGVCKPIDRELRSSLYKGSEVICIVLLFSIENITRGWSMGAMFSKCWSWPEITHQLSHKGDPDVHTNTSSHLNSLCNSPCGLGFGLTLSSGQFQAFSVHILYPTCVCHCQLISNHLLSYNKCHLHRFSSIKIRLKLGFKTGKLGWRNTFIHMKTLDIECYHINEVTSYLVPTVAVNCDQSSWSWGVKSFQIHIRLWHSGKSVV